MTEARFMVSPDRGEGAWVHPLEVPTQTPGWIDCTDMDDDALPLRCTCPSRKLR